MDSIQKLIENIGEYQDLLGFLHQRHPTVLEQYKNKKFASELPKNSEAVVERDVNNTQETNIGNSR